MSEEIMGSSEPILEENEVQEELQPEAIVEDPTKPSVQNNNALKEMIKELELKVNGKTIKKKIDLSNEAELIKEFQIAEANRQGMSKAAEYERLFKEQMDKINGDPLEYAAKVLGIDVEELAAQRLTKAIEEKSKSPDQIRAEKEAKEIEEIRKENERLKKEFDESRFLQLQEKEAAKFKQEMETALSKYPSLPKNSKLVNDKIVDIMLWTMDQGIKDVSIESILPTVEAELTQELNNMMDSLPEDFIEKYVGKKNSERMRLKRISNAQKTTSLNVPQTTTQTEAKKAADPAKKTKAGDFFRNLK